MTRKYETAHLFLNNELNGTVSIDNILVYDVERRRKLRREQ